MSAFSFTAPLISEEEEKAEREAFTEQERQELRDDLYGGNGEPPPETDEMLENAVALLRESLEGIPDSEKMDYLEALERAPELVESESPLVAFLRCEKFDAWAAARKLVTYWKVRKEIFGPDLAFLPMTLDGAMHEEIEHLQKGMVMVLPDDKHGRQVFFIDRIRCIRAVAPKDSISRCFYYMMHIMTETESGQKNGSVNIVNLRGYDLYTHFDRIQSRRWIKIYYSLPLLARAAHLCTGSGRGVLGVVLPVLKHVLGKHFRHRLVVHTGSDEEFIQGMELHGLEHENIPSLLGGDFTRADSMLG